MCNNGNYIAEILEKILILQQQSETNINLGCERPFISNNILANTRPIMLYLCNNNPLEIEYTSDNQTLLSNTFRVEGLDNSTVTVRLLNNSNGTITSTNETATINMNCIAAIKCLQDINLTL